MLLPPLSRLVSLAGLASLLACSVEVNGTGPLAAGTEISSSGNTVAVPDGAAGSLDAGNAGEAMAATTCNGQACIVVPPGWALVAFAPTRAAVCPTGFTQALTEIVEGPDWTKACDCGQCNVTKAPTCTSGPLHVQVDPHPWSGSPACSTEPTWQFTNDAPGCDTVPFGMDVPDNMRFVPPAASGGTCTLPGRPQAAKITYALQGRVCHADGAGSTGCTCAPRPPGPYAACIMATGQVACPLGMLNKSHIVGTDVSPFTCADCGCSVTGECFGGSVSFYTDPSCQGGALDSFPADGACRSVTRSSLSTFTRYQYSGASPRNVACAASAPSKPSTTALTNVTTICCAP
ncbi:MAG TPA: hypothetical protein VGY54_19760 [Polyangiaceae bacterium]|nr:hypothetical protein [Polyangiaceae bacterium]